MNTVNEQRKAQIEYNLYRICELLNWTKDDYNTHVFETATQYLDKYFDGDNLAIKRISSQAPFWNWFINLWNARNEAFRDEWDGLEDSTTPEEFRTIYFDIHNSAVLSAELAPPRCIYPNDFPAIKMEMA